MRRVLLTGASGFLGAHVLKYLLNSMVEIDVVCPYTMRHKGVPERFAWALDGAASERFTPLWHDLATPINATTTSLIGPVDIILNFASDTHPPRSVTHPVEFMHNNVDIALYLLEYARAQATPPAFVQISTNSVYGPAAEGSSHPEWDSIIPNNPYGASKVAQEALAISYWRSYNLPVTLINTMNPIGETQDTEKFIPSTIAKVIKGETVDIHAAANGDIGKRTYIDAPEMIDGMLYSLLQDSPVRSDTVDRPARWHVAGRQEINNLEVAEIIADELALPLKVNISAVDRPEHGHRYSLSGDKLAQVGWQASESIEPAIRRIASWTAANSLWTI